MHVNLLPTAYRQSLVIHRVLRKWLRIWLVLSALALVGGGWEYRQYKQTQESSERILLQVRHLYEVQSGVALLESNIARLQGESRRIAALLPPDEIVSVCQRVAGGVHAAQATTQLTDMKVFPVATPEDGSSSNAATVEKPNEQKSSVILSGLATDDLAVSDFVLGLRDTLYFSSVTLKTSSHTTAPNGSARQFQIECTY